MMLQPSSYKINKEIKTECLLCKSSSVYVLAEVACRTIVSLYKKQLNIDVRPYLTNCTTIVYYQCARCNIRFFSPTVAGKESFYEELQKFDWYYQTYKSEYAYSAGFTSNRKVLEIGCGAGCFIEYAAAHSYKGLEFNQQAIDQCLQNGGDVEKVSISEFSESHLEEYDVVCAFQVIEHVTDPLTFLQSALVCLKSNGRLILSVPSEDSFVGRSCNNILNMPPHHLSRWQDAVFHYISERLNIRLLAIHHEALDPIHYKWYSVTVAQQIVKKCFLQPTGKIVDETIGDRITSKLGTLLGKILTRLVVSGRIPPAGHSVTAVFEKP